MDKTLLLLRHGKSDWGIACDDFHRPLKKRGRVGAKKIGRWLKKNDFIPDYVITSPAARALSTAEICLEQMQDRPVLIKEPKVYGGSRYDLIALLRQSPENAQKVLLVGHNPDLDDLLLYLVKHEIDWPEDGKLMATATLACLAVPDSWQHLDADCARLLSLTRAAFLD